MRIYVSCALAAHLLSVFGVDGDDQNAFNWAKRSAVVSTPESGRGGGGKGDALMSSALHTHRKSASNADDDQ